MLIKKKIYDLCYKNIQDYLGLEQAFEFNKMDDSFIKNSIKVKNRIIYKLIVKFLLIILMEITIFKHNQMVIYNKKFYLFINNLSFM